MFAVTGNHEYGLGKGPLARARDVRGLWARRGSLCCCDGCVALPDRGGSRLVLCGADYLTGGFGLLGGAGAPAARRPHRRPGVAPALRRQASPSSSSTASAVRLAARGESFRWPSPVIRTEANCGFPALPGCARWWTSRGEYLSGVYQWGEGRLVVSRGVGTSFLPFRLLTRPEATLWRLV